VRAAIESRATSNRKPPMAKKIGASLEIAPKLGFTPGGGFPAGCCERSMVHVWQIEQSPKELKEWGVKNVIVGPWVERKIYYLKVHSFFKCATM
jgi:hypothetical protein